MSRKRLVGKPVLMDKLKPELGAEIVDLVLGDAPPCAPEPNRPGAASVEARRRARAKRAKKER
jgi:hypothetical protein